MIAGQLRPHPANSRIFTRKPGTGGAADDRTNERGIRPIRVGGSLAGKAALTRCLLILFLTAGYAAAQRAVLRYAEPVSMPGQVDSNSPAFWVDGEMHLINSVGGETRLSRGPSQYNLSSVQSVSIARNSDMPAWIEAVWVDPSGVVLGWYHQEEEWLCGTQRPALPRIGAAFSYDGGRTFFDAGIVLSSGVAHDCSHANGYFAGGHGDFTVVLDREQRYFHFLLGNYGGPLQTQGVVAARMRFEDRFHPQGAVWKYHLGSWNEPGVAGQTTPILPAAVSWALANADAFWGPSVHWNTHLNTWVMLLNRSCCDAGWPQAGIYISFNPNVSDPEGWTAPVKMLDDSGWYPQIIGMGEGESDSVAGQKARLYIYGHSSYEIMFLRDDEPYPGPEPEP